MNSKIMLVYVPGVEIHPAPMYPLGLGYLTPSLKQDRLVKSLYFQYIDQVLNSLPGFMLDFQPDILGLTCTTFNRGNVKSVCEWCRKTYPNTKIIIGGVHATFLPEQMLINYDADYVVMGEGEITIRELCNAIDGKIPLSIIDGIAYKENNNIIITKARVPISNLDELPLPDFSYAADLMRKTKLGYIITSRGCPANCIFCSTSSYWGQKVRMNSVDRVLQELEFLISEYGVSKILFHDDTFNLGIKRVMDICNEIISRKLNITWGAQCRVHPVSQEMIDKMVEAGCRHICWGVETGSTKMLEKINKKITKEQIKITYEMCRKHIGTISVGAFAIVGNPGENDETINESAQFFNNIPLVDRPSVATLYIMPGTKLYYDLKEKHPDIDNFWIENTGVLLPDEYTQEQLNHWAGIVNNSGEMIPFDTNNHFLNNMLYGNIPQYTLNT